MGMQVCVCLCVFAHVCMLEVLLSLPFRAGVTDMHRCAEWQGLTWVLTLMWKSFASRVLGLQPSYCFQWRDKMCSCSWPAFHISRGPSWDVCLILGHIAQRDCSSVHIPWVPGFVSLGVDPRLELLFHMENSTPKALRKSGTPFHSHTRVPGWEVLTIPFREGCLSGCEVFSHGGFNLYFSSD